MCATTKNTIRYREINPQGNAAELLDLTVDEPAITFHIMTLDCDKIYEIAVSSWFGELQSDWSISWRVKTKSGVVLIKEKFVGYPVQIVLVSPRHLEGLVLPKAYYDNAYLISLEL